MNSTTYKPKNYFPECPTDQSPPVILLPKTQALEKRINSNVTIECQYVSVIKITAIVWNFNSLKTGESKQIPDTSLNGTYSTTEPSLVIKQFGQDDQGLYYCTVSNAKGSSYQMHHINITLLSESPSPIINEHQSAEFGQNLSCKIDVYPAVQNVWWKLNNDVVNYNGSMVAEIYIRTDDLGFYQCCAQNTVGKNCSEGVLVGAKPNVLGITQTNEGFLGKPVNITCDVKSIPQLYNIEWLINDQVIDKIPLHYNIRTKLEEALDSIRTLTYTILTGDTQFPDNKSYTCNATNAFGSKLSPPLFVEIYGVVFYTTPENKVIYGQDITLYCNADSRPNITEVHWHQNNSCIRYNAMKNGITDIHNRVLQIRNTSFDDAGNYTCHIINPKVNKTSNIMQLIVLGGKPNVDSFAIGSEDRNYITVNQSVEVILVCNYTAIPNALSLSWTRTLNGQPKRISPLAKGGTITSPNLTFICDSSVEFDGNYRCTVTNAVGVTDGKTILVKVNESIPMCPCDCEFKKKLLFWKEKNFTKEQMLEYIKPLMEEIEKDMTLDKVKLSQNIRKRTSAPDNRKSAQQIGAVGIAVIVCAFGMIIVFDILAFRECIRTIWGRNSRV